MVNDVSNAHLRWTARSAAGGPQERGGLLANLAVNFLRNFGDLRLTAGILPYLPPPLVWNVEKIVCG